MARTFKPMLNNNGKSVHPCLVPDLRGNASSISTTDYDVCCGFVTDGLYYVEVGSFCAHFLESFYHKWMLHFVKSLFCIYWGDHKIFILLHNRRHTQAGVCRALVQTKDIVLTLPCLPQTAHYILLWSPKGSFLSQLISPLWRSGFLSTGTSPHLQLPTKVSGPFFYSAFLPLFFFLSSYLDAKGIFLVL